MEPFLENQQEQERDVRRAERIEQMRREKQLQEKRRRFIKKYWTIGISGLVVIVFIVVLATMLGGKSKANEKGQLVQNGASMEQAADQGLQSSGGSTESEVPDESEVLSNGDMVNIGTVEESDTNEPDGETDNEAQPTVSTTEPTAVPTTEPATAPTAEPAPSPNVGEESNDTLYIFKSNKDTVAINSTEVLSTHAILINESTDTIIASKGAYERISPASMTKVLTVLVAAEQIAEEDLDDTFQITLEYTDYAYINDCSSAGFAKDEVVKVRDLFYGTILPSGGEAAVALADYAAGSHEAFVGLMNEKLEELGLSDSAHFTNCVGLYDEKHYCTVYDMAVIMKAALQNDFCREVLSAHTYTTTATTQHPEGILLSNWFLRRIEDKESGGEVLCAKTGYVRQSQSCAVSYGEFAGETPYICVTVGSSSSWNCIYDHVEIYTRYVSKE